MNYRISVRKAGEIVRTATGTKSEVQAFAEAWRKEFLLPVIVGQIPQGGDLIFIEAISDERVTMLFKSSAEPCLSDQAGRSANSDSVKQKPRRRFSESSANEKALAYERSGKYVPIERVQVGRSEQQSYPDYSSSRADQKLASMGREFALRFK